MTITPTGVVSVPDAERLALDFEEVVSKAGWDQPSVLAWVVFPEDVCQVENPDAGARVVRNLDCGYLVLVDSEQSIESHEDLFGLVAPDWAAGLLFVAESWRTPSISVGEERWAPSATEHPRRIETRTVDYVGRDGATVFVGHDRDDIAEVWRIPTTGRLVDALKAILGLEVEPTYPPCAWVGRHIASRFSDSLCRGERPDWSILPKKANATWDDIVPPSSPLATMWGGVGYTANRIMEKLPAVADSLDTIRILGGDRLAERVELELERHGLADRPFAPEADSHAAPGQCVKELDLRATARRAPRNSPCPCGSDKKAKHCHARNAAPPRAEPDCGS